MSEFVVWFNSSETGAPVLNNAMGSLIGMLDACLVTGFNNKSVASITVAGGVATAVCNGHGFSGIHGQDVRIAGATPAVLNGRKALTFVNTNTFKFATTAADGVATGTITVKRDSLGWVKAFTGEGKAVYKRSDVTATSMMLRVDDTNTGVAVPTGARVLMVESATSVDEFSGAAPPDARVPGGYCWSKGQNNSSAKQWTLIGDSKSFYFVTQSGGYLLPSPTDAYASMIFAFGDFPSYKPGDAYNTLISGEMNTGSGGGGISHGPQPIGHPPASTFYGEAIFAARAFSQLGGAAAIGFRGLSRSHQKFVFPSPIDSGFALNPECLLIEAVPGGEAIRGTLPGFIEVLGFNAIDHLSIIEGVVDLPGRRVLGLQIYASGQTRVAFDITGPWR